MIVLLAALLLTLCGGAGGATHGAVPDAAARLPKVLLHLSDTHFSTNVEKYWALFGDRAGDMGLFAARVVPALAPARVLVTGEQHAG